MLGTRYRGRRQGVEIRAGSVEQARREARLTLAQVAAGKLTRTAIHLIEKGRTRPSMETLQLIARQTHKPIDFFLTAEASSVLTERQAQLRELERLTAVRQLEAVIQMGISLLDQTWSAEDTAAIQFSVGQAYCRLVRPTDALEHLIAARHQFERSGDEWMAVEALDWESSARGLLDDPDALPLANQALERCRAYQSTQQPGIARQHYDKALTLYSIESDLSAVYRVEIDLGDMLLQQGLIDAAEQHLLKALRGSDELRIDRRGHGYILTNLGDVHLRRGELPEANEYLMQALEMAEAIPERIVVANARVLLGKLNERQGNAALADDQFATAIRILEQLAMPDRLRDAHMEYAEVLDARDDTVAAAGHWKLAAEIGKMASLGVGWSADRDSLAPTGVA